MNLRILLLPILIAVALSSCVPQRKYSELETRKKALDEENTSLRAANEKVTAEYNECKTTVASRDKQVSLLTEDTARYGKSYRQLKIQYDKINELNDVLERKTNTLLQNASAENKKLLTDLNQTQEALQKKEDALKALEKSLALKQSAIDQTTADLKDREERLQELDALLKAQSEASEALREKVQNALLGFKDKGLSVSEKDGKVYVSMEAKLLFASGSTLVDPNGKKALVDLAKAIENEVDMEVIVEGHTDTDKISSSSIPRDNWELSVLRSTEVIKILLANSNIKPTILSASGRSEYHPVSSTDKSKNRRIEIILQPDLTELYKLIEAK